MKLQEYFLYKKTPKNKRKHQCRPYALFTWNWRKRMRHDTLHNGGAIADRMRKIGI